MEGNMSYLEQTLDRETYFQVLKNIANLEKAIKELYLVLNSFQEMEGLAKL
jgi:hypothetical protein